MKALIQKLSFIFFFQAEDGIRDYKVTGVQTCALPISISAVALVLAWLLLLLTRQGTDQQVSRARDAAGVSCSALQAGAARMGLAGLMADTPSAQAPSAPQAGLDPALPERPGMEGGFWGEGPGVVAYAFPTYDGSGIKRDAPSAEMERIASTAQRARDSAGLVTDLRPGLREAVVFAACPAQADAPALVAWTLMRVPLISADVVNPLILAVSLLLGMVLVSGLWLGRMLRRWQRQSAQMEQQLLSAERLATLGRLSAGLAHEIRNPLGTMRMKAENALAAPAPLREARSQGALEAVLAQTARLEDLVSSLLALTRSEEHTSELQSPCNLVCRLLLEKKKSNQHRYKRQLASPVFPDDVRSAITYAYQLPR